MFRRILLVLSLAAIMASMMVFSAVPAFAQPEDPCEFKEDDPQKVECQFGPVKVEEKEDKIEFTFPDANCEIKFDEGTEECSFSEE